MKNITLLLLLILLVGIGASGQENQVMKGSYYCAMKKASAENVAEKPLGAMSVAPHSFDAIKYNIEVDLYNCYTSPYPKDFSGSVILTFKAVTPINNIKLNAINFSLTVDSVRMNGVSFTHISDTLAIQLDQTYTAGQTGSVKIYYHHNNVIDNAFYATNGFVFTDCEPEGARHWVPCWDSPADKALFELTAKVKSTARLGSNGILADSTLNGDVLTYHWISNQNVATYLMVMTSRVNYQLNINYWHKLSNPADSIPLRYYFNPGEDPTPVMNLLPGMTTWFSQNFVEHPFDKNGFATLNSDFAWGGMENQTLTSLCPGCWSESLAAHEFAHQWFGDMITCATWADIWLNEGFATWSEAFWYESYGGYAAYKDDIDYDAGIYLSSNPGWAISNPSWATNTPPSGVLFNYAITYTKGACVLHQLRYVLGDSLFFAVLQSYANDTIYKYQSATIQDFNNKVNQVTGGDYSWFFDEWIYQPNHPVYQNTYNFEDLGNNEWKVNLFLTQSQTNTVFFKMPVEIKIKFEDASDTTIRLMNDVNYQQAGWTFNKRPVFLQFDPDRQIVLKEGNTIVGTHEITSVSGNSLRVSPNPAREKTTVVYTLARPAKVQMELCDITGKTIAMPLNTAMPAGTHETVIDCSDINAGTYLCKLKAGDNVLVRKLVIIK